MHHNRNHMLLALLTILFLVSRYLHPMFVHMFRSLLLLRFLLCFNYILQFLHLLHNYLHSMYSLYYIQIHILLLILSNIKLDSINFHPMFVYNPHLLLSLHFPVLFINILLLVYLLHTLLHSMYSLYYIQIHILLLIHSILGLDPKLFHSMFEYMLLLYLLLHSLLQLIHRLPFGCLLHILFHSNYSLHHNRNHMLLALLTNLLLVSKLFHPTFEYKLNLLLHLHLVEFLTHTLFLVYPLHSYFHPMCSLDYIQIHIFLVILTNLLLVSIYFHSIFVYMFQL